MKNETLIGFYVTRMVKLWKKSGSIIVLEQNEFTLMGPFRNMLISYHKRRNKRIPGNTSHFETKFTGTDKAAILKNLAINGYSTGINLPPAFIEDILAFTEKNPICSDNHAAVIVSVDDTIPPVKDITTYVYKNPHKLSNTIYELA